MASMCKSIFGGPTYTDCWYPASYKNNSDEKQKSHLHLQTAFEGEPAGTRTQGPYIKSVLLYQLSYEFNLLR